MAVATGVLGDSVVGTVVVGCVGARLGFGTLVMGVCGCCGGNAGFVGNVAGFGCGIAGSVGCVGCACGAGWRNGAAGPPSCPGFMAGALGFGGGVVSVWLPTTIEYFSNTVSSNARGVIRKPYLVTAHSAPHRNTSEYRMATTGSISCVQLYRISSRICTRLRGGSVT